MRAQLIAAIVAATLCIAPSAAAQDDESEHDLSITLSPIHLFLPVVELMGEMRANDTIGVGVVLGFGSASADTDEGDKVEFDIFEIGLQLLFYPLADFESLHFGGELMFVSVSLQDNTELDGQRVDVVASGLMMGPLLGYKLRTGVGFTLYVQAGIGFTVLEAEAETSDGTRVTDDESRLEPLINLNLGWSF